MAIKRRNTYARGTKSNAMDDRTGKKVKYTDLRQEWTGHMVHKDEWEPKHPQLEPRAAVDAEILRNPRVDNDNVKVFVKGRNMQGIEMRIVVLNTHFAEAQSHATPSGISITGTIGTEIPTSSANASGNAITGAVGSIQTGAGVAGVAITSALGSESLAISANVAETGVSTTVALGNEVPMALDLPAGVAITGAIGTVTVNAWGAGTWGSGTWGN